MLRNRASSVPRKQVFMADDDRNYIRSISSSLFSPRFRAFTAKVLFGETENSDETESFDNPKSKSAEPVSDNNTSSWDRHKLESGGIGLAIIDDPVREIEGCSKPRNAKVLFGPTVGVPVPAPAESSGFAPAKKSARVFDLGEMELSEDYTCVISRGQNPRTTHIFDNCIVESFSCAFSENFRNVCHTCNKNLVRKNDTYVYRGDKAFCSEECCNQGMVVTKGMESS